MTDQVEALVARAVPQAAGMSERRFRSLAAGLTGAGLVCVHPSLVPASQLAPLLRVGGRAGFVVQDMTDLDEFVPIASVDVPQRPLYLLSGIDRGDTLRGMTPDAALPVIADAGRTPLTIGEGISWLLQDPARLEPGHCFMCAASRKPTARGSDARVPAIWISRGTGRDGIARRNAPKIGWCWAGNQHDWLGFASAAARRG
ncbi:DUF5701 family protein [Propionicicella superfundia]|uniref:DUF5701 family protein n=1 Tax=Propionicicella superfundia TaxID=348582 RepID=UPI001B7F7DCE|nr:DUF5701 family protein [Propionicicella superfundia]